MEFYFSTGKKKSAPVSSETHEERATTLEKIFKAMGVDYTGESIAVDIEADKALTYAAVFGAVKAISEAVGSLPARIMKEDGDALLYATDSQYTAILRQPNEFMSFQTLREVMLVNALLWGNGIAKIERSNGGKTMALVPIASHRIKDIKLVEGKRVFHVEGFEKPLLNDEVFHIMGPTIDGIKGLSVIEYHRRTFGLGVTSQEFNKKFYERGGFFKGFLQLAGVLSGRTPKQVSDEWDGNWGGPSNMFSTPVLQNGMDYKSVSLPQRDAQTIEMAKFTIEDVARIFNVPLPVLKINDKSSYNSLEQQNIDFVTYNLRVWVKKIEDEFDRKILRVETSNFLRINLDGLLRGDTAARSEFYWKMFQMGAMNPNEIRRLENLNPRPDGDEYFTPSNMINAQQQAL